MLGQWLLQIMWNCGRNQNLLNEGWACGERVAQQRRTHSACAVVSISCHHWWAGYPQHSANMSQQKAGWSSGAAICMAWPWRAATSTSQEHWCHWIGRQQQVGLLPNRGKFFVKSTCYWPVPDGVDHADLLGWRTFCFVWNSERKHKSLNELGLQI